MLKKMGRQFNSFGLMQIANKAKSDPFVKIRSLIENMIAKLEKQAQEEYEEFMADAAEKRMQDSKSITDKSAVKADTEARLEEEKSDHKTTVKELMANDKTTMNLHASCDWLMKFFDVRKEARNGEIAALKNAKAVLSGANYA